MDRKRELTSVDLAALCGELGDYEGAKVDKVYLYDDGLVRFRMRDFDRGRVELLVDTGETKHLRVADADNVPDAPGRPPNFAMMLRNRLSGADLAGVEQYGFDRIVTLEFERGDEDTTVVAELFGDGNVAVLDETGDVVDCLETVRLKSRTVAPGSTYEFPSSRFNPLEAEYEAFAAKMDDSDADVVRTLATQLDFGGFWGEELCSRAGVEKTMDIGEAGDDQYEPLFSAIEDLRDRLVAADLDPRVYYEGSDDGGADGESGTGADGEDGGEASGRGLRVDATPIPMAEYDDLPSDSVEAFTAALDEYFTNWEAEPETGPEDGGGRDRPDFESEIEKQKRIIEQQQGAIEDFEAQAETEREKAELLYAEYDLVDEIVATVQQARENDVSWDDIEAKFDEGADRGIEAAEAVAGVDGSEGTVTIELGGHRIDVNASMGVEKNADRRYTEAKRIEDKKEGAQEAIANTREELEAVEQRRDEWDAGDDDGGAGGGESTDDEQPEHVDWLARDSVPVRSSEQWYEEYRWFHTSDDFLVIGGRNADQNEDLVKKYMDGGDKFFHAQAHGGPVTVLKATGPSEPARDVDFPDSTLRETAQFALSYSSVWKEGKYADDVYMVDPNQVSKTPESGEFLEKGGFAVRGDRTYFEAVAASVAVGIKCEPDTRVIGGPPTAVVPKVETSIELEPGRYAQNDMAKLCYREFKDRFVDESFVRNVASPDLIQEFLPPGGSRMVED
ncbi:ribosome rescue protein RqcH [Halorientalis sp.]|uniref:ribosome rescue protein RqcH n=1 Tax=Halorientalis sp. TaxID=1931229 RepID=UPI00261FC278|nr:ribosome rescue protein RqcH [Halorientalis sp.]